MLHIKSQRSTGPLIPYTLHTTTTAEGIRRVPPAEETKRALAEQEAAQGGGKEGGKEWCLAAGFNPAKLKVRCVFCACVYVWGGRRVGTLQPPCACVVLSKRSSVQITNHTTHIPNPTQRSAPRATSWPAWCSWKTRGRRKVGAFHPLCMCVVVRSGMTGRISRLGLSTDSLFHYIRVLC